MDRAFESGASASPPTAPASPSVGYPTAGNPATATPATKPGPWWYYMVTEELRALVTAAGLTPDQNDVTQVTQAVQQLVVGVPVGVVAHFAMNAAPTGWLKANGAAVSRTAYAALFAAIGTTYGVGDGSTTFNLPDLRGEFVRGLDDGRGVDSGRAIGSAQTDENKAHGHAAGNGGTSFFGLKAGGANAVASGSGAAYLTGETAQSGGVEARPRNIAMLACIKY